MPVSNEFVTCRSNDKNQLVGQTITANINDSISNSGSNKSNKKNKQINNNNNNDKVNANDNSNYSNHNNDDALSVATAEAANISATAAAAAAAVATAAATTDEKEYNCHECCYQGVAESDLKRHIILKHETPINQSATFKCRTCGNGFSHKWELMKHRKSSHRDTVAMCRNWRNGSCPYTEEACWWNHVEKILNGNHHTCYICGTTFDTKNQLMLHRKKEHGHIVGLCKEAQKQNYTISCPR